MEDQEKSAAGPAAGRPRIGFYIHLTTFVLVNALLLAINLATSPNYLWFLWALAGWSLGILFHAGLIFYLPKRSGGGQRRVAPELRGSLPRPRSRSK